MTRWTAAGVSLALAGCFPAPPPAPVPPEIMPSAAVARPDPALLDPFVGRYASDGATIVVRRSGDRLVAERAGVAAAPLTFVGNGTFADAAGNSYLFTASASGRRLTLIAPNGTRRDWAG